MLPLVGMLNTVDMNQMRQEVNTVDRVCLNKAWIEEKRAGGGLSLDALVRVPECSLIYHQVHSLGRFQMCKLILRQ